MEGVTTVVSASVVFEPQTGCERILWRSKLDGNTQMSKAVQYSDVLRV